ncbi:hypothetical protein [Methanobacterium petrolearium]|uniref:hypothetical protein n=1 Tax=Methanobacterium petrolearium TaxID=710190 RepID=UPI001FD76EA5|nr:hypothetical protein [Methanobacterium petrolearium]MBP1946977.1 hypothetical protein [Methanobacterium petrolearium]BDZ71476.1 hypothetical protein GCM10025861_19930 [Methanobacterium petrolearium]
MALFENIKQKLGRGKNKKGFLVCEKCGGYYELQPGESPEDFAACECGGDLNYTKTFNIPNQDSENKK